MIAAFCIYCLLLLCVQGTSSQTLLLAGDSGVQTLTVTEAPSLTTIHPQHASSIDFRFTKADVYFISNKEILYSYYSQITRSHADPMPTVKTNHALTDLVLDWHSFKLYFSCRATNAIYEAALLGSTPRQIFSNVVDVGDLAIDPYERLLFFIKDKALFSFDLLAHKTQQYDLSTRHISSVVKVAVEHHKMGVFVIGHGEAEEETHSWTLAVTDYNNQGTRLLFRGVELSGAFALDVFNDQVVWGALRDGVYTLYFCTLTPACHTGHLKIVLKTNEPVHDVRLYHPLVQTPAADYACRQLNCSHTCSVVSLYTVSCSCPEGLVVHPDDNQCREPPPMDTPPWTQTADELLVSLADSLHHWLGGLTPHLVMFILACCALMLTLLTCGLCLLPCAGKPQHQQGRESFGLRERRHPITPPTTPADRNLAD